jgi:hypothetical protein
MHLALCGVVVYGIGIQSLSRVREKFEKGSRRNARPTKPDEGKSYE